MQNIQTPRFFGHETGTRYCLDLQTNCEATNSLTACFLLAKDTNLTFNSLSFSERSRAKARFLTKKELDEIQSCENFIKQFINNTVSWHLQMHRNGYPISFGSCCNNEIGCTYHHWCLIDVDKLIEDIETRIQKGVI